MHVLITYNFVLLNLHSVPIIAILYEGFPESYAEVLEGYIFLIIIHTKRKEPLK